MALELEETQQGSGTNTKLTLNLGSAPQDDLLVAFAGGSSSLVPSISGTGWNEYERVTNSFFTNLSCFYKVAGASEPTAITFTWSSSIFMAGAVLRLSNVDTADPYENSAQNTGSAKDAVCGTAGGTDATSKIAAAYWAAGTTSIDPPTNGYTTQVDEDSGNATLVVATDLTDGSSEGVTITSSVSANYSASNAGFIGLSSNLVRVLRAEGKY